MIITVLQALDTLDFAPQIRSNCVASLSDVCANYTMLPRSLHFELPVNAMDNVRYRSGSASVLRGKCNGRELAVKALWPQGLSLQEMKKVSKRLWASLFP